jgi:hypothetical protein
MNEILLFVVIICIYFIPIVVSSLMAKWNKLEGMSLFTKLLAPTITPFPIETPLVIIVFGPM